MSSTNHTRAAATSGLIAAWLPCLALAATLGLACHARTPGTSPPEGEVATQPEEPPAPRQQRQATSSAMPSSTQPRQQFEALAQELARSRQQVPGGLTERDLDGDGTVERIALLCSSPERGHAVDAAYFIEKGDSQRWLVAFDQLDGRSRIGAGGLDCSSPAQGWIPSHVPWIELAQGHRGGGAICRFALRQGYVALIWRSYIDDIRAGDTEEITDYNLLHQSEGRAYPRLADVAGSLCDLQAKVVPISAARARELLAPTSSSP